MQKSPPPNGTACRSSWSLGAFPRGEKGGSNLHTRSRRYDGLRVLHQFTTSPMGPPMKEKELRLALVCSGGVSLVLYMHGVIKEILKLSRASKAYHSVPQSEQREHRSYEAANGDDGRPHDTEDVYFTLLQSIGRT